MANVPEKQQIVPEDFKPDEQEMAGKIAGAFNPYVEQLDNILDNGLTVGDNLRAEIRVVEVTGGQPTTFSYARSSKPVGLWVIDYRNTTDPTEVLTVAVQAKWSYDGRGNITLENVTGLTGGENYNITVIAISG